MPPKSSARPTGSLARPQPGPSSSITAGTRARLSSFPLQAPPPCPDASLAASRQLTLTRMSKEASGSRQRTNHSSRETASFTLRRQAVPQVQIARQISLKTLLITRLKPKAWHP